MMCNGAAMGLVVTALASWTAIPSGAMSAPALPASTTCAPTRVKSGDITYHWLAIHVRQPSCPVARRILHAYFGGHAQPAGPVPRDGDYVEGWLCHTGPAVPNGTPARCSRRAATITAKWE